MQTVKEMTAEEKEQFMAFTRKMLKAMGIEDEKIDQIIDAHVETVDGIKEKYSDYETIKADLGKVTKERDDLKVNTPEDNSQKITDLEKQIEGYKNAETLSAKKKAYKDVLKQANIDEKRFDSILKVTDFNKIELEDGKIKNVENYVKSVETEFADFKLQTQNQNHTPDTPPNTNTNETDPSKMDYHQYKAWRANNK